jgi:cytoplasmic iron level regulating protein YaaA (DUF328/UPF0246 family)
MTDKIVINCMNPLQESGTKITYMEGYPLYPFFKKIYDEYLREMNAGADHLLESINADAENTASKKNGTNVYVVS